MSKAHERQSLHDHLQRAFTLAERGDVQTAEREFLAILAVNPNLLEARYGLARAMQRQGRNAEVEDNAESLLQQIVEECRSLYPPLMFHAGWAFMKLKRFQLAVKALQTALTLLPARPEISVALARCKLALGDAHAAEDLARRALSISAENIPALFVLAQSLDRQDRLEEAITGYRRLVDRSGDYPAARGRLAHCLFRAGRFDEAEHMAAEAAIREPDTLAFAVIARCAARRDDYVGAEFAYLSLVRAPAFLAAQRRIYGSLQREDEDVEDAPIVRNFWNEYSEVLRAQGWFARACAESAAYTSPSEPHIPDTWTTAADGQSPQITLLSFSGTPVFRQHQERLSRSALDIGGIGEAALWTSEELRKTRFYDTHKTLLDLPRGAGCWVWKPFVILNELLRRQESEVVIYYDCGRGGGHAFTKSARDLADWCARDRRGFLPATANPRVGPNKLWTKRDCFYFMGCDVERYWNHDQVRSTFSIWRNSAAARDFVRDWLKFAVDPRIVTDHPNVCGLPNFDGFLDHRQDQSILTNLVCRDGFRLPVHTSADINGLAAILPPPGQ